MVAKRGDLFAGHRYVGFNHLPSPKIVAADRLETDPPR
jgi:hypothetical protein